MLEAKLIIVSIFEGSVEVINLLLKVKKFNALRSIQYKINWFQICQKQNYNKLCNFCAIIL